MTTPEAADDLSLRSVLEHTLKDFGVQAAPTPAPAAAAPAERTSQGDITKLLIDRRTQALIAVGALLVIAVAGYLWSTFSASTAAPSPAPKPAATLAATLAPTVPRAAPTAAPAALVSYFDYRDPSSAAPITANQIERVVGRASGNWRLVDVGNARVWITADRVPVGVPVAEPLPDLTPRRPAPAAPALAQQPASAPVPAAQPASAPASASAPCSADTAPFVVRRQVLAGTLPIGEAMGFSCVSAADAETNASQHEAEVRASYQATTTAKP